MRECEYCQVKLDNDQIDKFYQLGKQWRETDKEMLLRKIDWYKNKQADLKEQIEVEREATQLDRAALERELDKIEEENSEITEQKVFH